MSHLAISEKKKKVSNPNKNIIRGKFPAQQSLYEKPVIFRVNTILIFSLLIVMILSMLSYLVVITKESKIKELHSVTNKINYENIELQNKVDYLKSFYALDNKVQQIGFLKKADKVIEVNSQAKIPIKRDKRKKFEIKSVPGF